MSGQDSGSEFERVLRLHAVLGDEGIDDAVLDHHRVVEHSHVGHAAVGVARIDVAAEEGELLRGRLGWTTQRDDGAVLVHDPAHGSPHHELVDDDAHRDARVAALAVGHVGDVLAAAEAAAQQIVDEAGRLLVGEVREELSLQASREIGAGLRSSDVEFRKVLLLFRHSLASLAGPGVAGRQP